MSHVLIFNQQNSSSSASKQPPAADTNGDQQQATSNLMANQQEPADMQQRPAYSQCVDCSMRPSGDNDAPGASQEQRGLKRQRPADQEEAAGDSQLIECIELGGQLTQMMSVDHERRRAQPDEKPADTAKGANNIKQEQVVATDECGRPEGEGGEQEAEEEDGEEEQFNYEPVLSKILNEKKLTLANCPEVIQFLSDLHRNHAAKTTTTTTASSSASSSSNNSNNMINHNN